MHRQDLSLFYLFLGVSLTFDFNVTLLISGGVGDDGKSIDSNHERVLKCERSVSFLGCLFLNVRVVVFFFRIARIWFCFIAVILITKSMLPLLDSRKPRV